MNNQYTDEEKLAHYQKKLAFAQLRIEQLSKKLAQKWAKQYREEFRRELAEQLTSEVINTETGEIEIKKAE